MTTALFDELKRLEHEFKASINRNDEAATERLNSAIGDLESKMRALEAAANRPQVDAITSEAKAAFTSYLRAGDQKMEAKAMSALVPGEGGYTVPKEIEANLARALVDISPMRSIARVITASTTDYRIPFSVGGTASSWVGEKAARPETVAPTIVEIVPAFGELYASPFVTQTLLEDSQFDIESYIVTEIATEFARAEGAAFLTGDGTNKPKGLLTTPTALTTDATRPFGTVQHVTSGAATDITSPDKLVDLVQSLKAGYRANAKFIASRDGVARVRKLKDSTGQFIWRAGLEAGQASTLLGYEVVEMEDMPAVAAGSLSIAFGDFNAAYTIADRVGVSLLRNPYSNAPYIAFQTRQRVGGAPVDTAAYKVLKTGA